MKNYNKAIDYTAIGLLLIVLNIYVDFGAFRINIVPNWIGFILMFFALKEFEEDRTDHLFLKIMTIIAALYAISEWIIDILGNPIEIAQFGFVFSLIQLLVIFDMTEIVIKTAAIENSLYEHKLNVTRTVLVLGFVLTLLSSILTYYIDEMFGLAATLSGAVVLVCAVIMIIMMYGFRNELNNEGSL